MSYPPEASSTPTIDPPVTTSSLTDRSELHVAALDHATRGIPIFPCKPGGKSPLTRRGFYDATTEHRQVEAWWKKNPEANIGIPTGARSGLLVIDVDKGTGGYATLEALEEEHDHLPRTATTKTGGGGMHLVFRYPSGEELRSSAGNLGPGLDVRAEGGYIVAPPSRTTGTYEVLEDVAPVDPPGWLVEALREPQRGEVAETTSTGQGEKPTVCIEGGPIPSGQRNVELTRIAGSLRARGYEKPELEAALLEASRSRCTPPLPEKEVCGIAASVSRYPAGKALPKVVPETHKTLDIIENHIYDREFKGQGGYSNRDTLIKLVELSRVYGRLLPSGDVAVSVSRRQLAELAAVGVGTASRAVGRLQQSGDVRLTGKGRKTKTDAGTIVLAARKVEHSNQEGGGIEEEGSECSTPRSSSPRLRWSAPRREKVGRTWETTVTRRLGKSCGAIIDHIEAAGGELSLPELLVALHKPKLRARDLLRESDKTVGPLMRLIAAGVVEYLGDVGRRCDVVRLTPDWTEALERERQDAGEVDAARRQRVRHRREREAFARRHEEKTEPAPTLVHMDERRNDYPRRRRAAIEAAIASLFAARPEFRAKRVGQVTCALHQHLPEDFPRRLEDGYPKDVEVERILEGSIAATGGEVA